mmetsp:Transcript_13435/g.25910  ORF Transcript_13435/g.25910 Transcript_13435/m.25910 type:complete len:521 (+) Transcript_13435:1000-2562(+)|eukprot:CAMPEP_0171588556 /NCGR_PEP_ID=MMETSP0961-20121227/14194_1 /TAXON_ID=87120 /ORGANISM="Aurantiochytrium limacinum, Strain ATCCMYA-1381" /LENGTH=520 /DNA_ID=CAMNT_0012147427 /DNA_START=880 /DNA_END=2442 /DNA_ORIENTATION=-
MGNGGSDMCCRLRSAAQNGRKDECIQFLKEGAPVTCQDNLYKSTALHEACRFGHHEVASLLLKHHAEVDALDCIGHTPLFYAAKGGFNSIINLLIERGANVNAVSTKGKTALHSAMEHGQKVGTLLLIDAGARLDAHDCEGRTPCQLAAQKGHLDALVACKLVLENSQSSTKIIDSIIDLEDPKIPHRSKILLHAWQVAGKAGKPFPVPKTCDFDAESDDPLTKFLQAAQAGSAFERKSSTLSCISNALGPGSLGGATACGLKKRKLNEMDNESTPHERKADNSGDCMPSDAPASASTSSSSSSDTQAEVSLSSDRSKELPNLENKISQVATPAAPILTTSQSEAAKAPSSSSAVPLSEESSASDLTSATLFNETTHSVEPTGSSSVSSNQFDEPSRKLRRITDDSSTHAEDSNRESISVQDFSNPQSDTGFVASQAQSEQLLQQSMLPSPNETDAATDSAATQGRTPLQDFGHLPLQAADNTFTPTVEAAILAQQNRRRSSSTHSSKSTLPEERADVIE